MTSVPATWPSLSTVARSVISMTSSTSCETKMTLDPSPTMPPDHVEEAIDVASRQEGCGLVEDEQAAAPASLPLRARRPRVRSRGGPAPPAPGAPPPPPGRWRARNGRNRRALRARAPSGGPSCGPRRGGRSGDSPPPSAPESGPDADGRSDPVLPGISRAAAAVRRARPCTARLLPGSGSWNPARILISVDLPEPFWPSRP